MNADITAPESSHLADSLSQVEDFLRRYIAFPSPAHSPAIALWVAHSHALAAFDYTPYLHVSSPEKRCGKSRVLDALALLVPEPWVAVSPSEAVIYRKISISKPTLLLDEVDTIFTGGKDENKEGLRALLNAGSAAQPPFDTVPVDQDRRIELKLSVVEATLGTKLNPRQTIRVWGFVGTEGQIQLLPPQSELAQLRDKFENGAGADIRWQDSTDERFETHRRLAGFLRIRCHCRERGKNVQISFPADAVHLEVIETRKRLVVVARGEVLEFWRIDRWKKATSIADLSAFTDEVRRILDDGEPSS